MPINCEYSFFAVLWQLVTVVMLLHIWRLARNKRVMNTWVVFTAKHRKRQKAIILYFSVYKKENGQLYLQLRRSYWTFIKTLDTNASEEAYAWFNYIYPKEAKWEQTAVKSV